MTFQSQLGCSTSLLKEQNWHLTLQHRQVDLFQLWVWSLIMFVVQSAYKQMLTRTRFENLLQCLPTQKLCAAADASLSLSFRLPEEMHSPTRGCVGGEHKNENSKQQVSKCCSDKRNLASVHHYLVIVAKQQPIEILAQCLQVPNMSKM